MPNLHKILKAISRPWTGHDCSIWLYKSNNVHFGECNRIWIVQFGPSSFYEPRGMNLLMVEVGAYVTCQVTKLDHMPL